MNCPDNENVCSVNKENNLGYYRLHTIWRSNGFFINITSKDGAWRGEMTENDMKEISSQLEISPDAYLEQCKEALTCHDGKPGMVYAVEDGMFTWKKVVDEDSGIKIKMGSVMLEPTSFVNTIQNLVSVALNCNKKLQNEIRVLAQEKEKYVANRNELISKLNELIKAKEEMENNLYKRFLLLLNTKKKKILELENILQGKAGISKPIPEQNLVDPYEIETEEEEEEEDFEKEISPRKRKPEKEGSLSLSGGEACEEKKAKNIEEAVNDMSLKSSDISDNLEAGPSKVTKTEKPKIPSTTDEFLDYFFGTV